MVMKTIITIARLLIFYSDNLPIVWATIYLCLFFKDCYIEAWDIVSTIFLTLPDIVWRYICLDAVRWSWDGVKSGKWSLKYGTWSREIMAQSIQRSRPINTLRPRQMDAISQTTFSNAFSWMKMHEIRLRYHRSLYLRFELTIFQHWFR